MTSGSGWRRGQKEAWTEVPTACVGAGPPGASVGAPLAGTGVALKEPEKMERLSPVGCGVRVSWREKIERFSPVGSGVAESPVTIPETTLRSVSSSEVQAASSRTSARAKNPRAILNCILISGTLMQHLNSEFEARLLPVPCGFFISVVGDPFQGLQKFGDHNDQKPHPQGSGQPR